MPYSLLNAEGPKKATNVSINEQLLVTAKALKVNISNASERGLAQAVAEKKLSCGKRKAKKRWIVPISMWKKMVCL
jgi:post-segregation antitoxin (ccd killing protein)